MRKRANFDTHWGRGWPEPSSIKRYFVGEQKNPWLFETGSDSAGLTADGVDGTEHLEANKGRIDVRLTMWGHPVHGVLLMYEKMGGGFADAYYCKGDLSRLREWVRSMHGTPLPVGLFIPYGKAWPAVKEFIETDGLRSDNIEWIAAHDLPPNTFPDRFRMPE